MLFKVTIFIIGWLVINIIGFWKMLFTRPILHVLVIGLDQAGKTTMLEKIKRIFCNQEGIPPEKVPPTVGMNRKNA